MATKSIGIDIREAHDKGAGKGRYAKEITKALIEEAPQEVEFVLLTNTPNKSFENSDRVKQVVISGRGLKWQFKLRKYLKIHPVDWFISPTSYIYPAIAPTNQKTAVVVHDLIAFLYAKYNKLFATIVERLTLGRALRKSSLIITVSEHTWKDLVKKKPQAKGKHHVVAYNAVSRELHKVNTNKLNLPEKFLLAVGTLQPRKNFKAIFEAFRRLAVKDETLELCIIGGKGWKASSIYKSVPEGLKERVHFLGYIRNEELMEAYSKAEALVFPSFYEGFGLPPLEAMACECPVVTSNVSSLPEVVGDAAFMVDPNDDEALAEAIAEITKPELKKEAIKLGLERAKHFSWQESARRILTRML